MMTRTIVTLSPRQIALLKKTALLENSTVSALIRKAVDLLMKKRAENPIDRIMLTVKKIEACSPSKGKITHDSKNIDEIVYG